MPRAPRDGPVYHIRVENSQNTHIYLPGEPPKRRGILARLFKSLIGLAELIKAVFTCGN